MPLLSDDMEQHTIGAGGYGFTGQRIDSLTAPQYTLVTIFIDVTGSVSGFADELKQMLQTAIDACKKSPYSENILVRVVLFSTKYSSGLFEVHGFVKLSDVDVANYPDIIPGGGTPLYDAVYSALGSSLVYGKQLFDADFGVNAIAFIITDGDDNASAATPRMIKEQMELAVSGETIESMVSVLIGINAKQYLAYLENFQKEANLTYFIDAGDATPAALAKLAALISQSVSSQSQAAGTGGPSQNISATI
jgi:uncharacterized protein YegL